MSVSGPVPVLVILSVWFGEAPLVLVGSLKTILVLSVVTAAPGCTGRSSVIFVPPYSAMYMLPSAVCSMSSGSTKPVMPATFVLVSMTLPAGVELQDDDVVAAGVADDHQLRR